MTKHLKTCLVALLLAGFAFADDMTEPETKAPPKADVRGTVKKLTVFRGQGSVGGILVEGSKEKDTTNDKASVTVTTATKIYRWVNGKKKDAKFTDIKEGSTVQCVFTGPVLESYPVQAKAGEVLILADPKK